ncbi:MAG: hypothetical protein R2789_15035 [Microthrixaceae bacterium]
MVNGLTIDIPWPVFLALVALVAGWQLFLSPRPPELTASGHDPDG